MIKGEDGMARTLISIVFMFVTFRSAMAYYGTNPVPPSRLEVRIQRLELSVSQLQQIIAKLESKLEVTTPRAPSGYADVKCLMEHGRDNYFGNANNHVDNNRDAKEDAMNKCRTSHNLGAGQACAPVKFSCFNY
jgi:hypothetical protein